jgi:hypothetical protein
VTSLRCALGRAFAFLSLPIDTPALSPCPLCSSLTFSSPLAQRAQSAFPPPHRSSPLSLLTPPLTHSHASPLDVAVSTVTRFRSTSSRALSRPRRSASPIRGSALPPPSSSRAASRRTTCSRSSSAPPPECSPFRQRPLTLLNTTASTPVLAVCDETTSVPKEQLLSRRASRATRHCNPWSKPTRSSHRPTVRRQCPLTHLRTLPPFLARSYSRQ